MIYFKINHKMLFSLRTLFFLIFVASYSSVVKQLMLLSRISLLLEKPLKKYYK